MLVLSRRPQETIVAGNIVIKTLRCYSGVVKIGIVAPDSVRVRRGEKLDADSPPDFEAAAEHVVSLCDAAFGDLDSMPPTLAEFYQSARSVVGTLSEAA